MRLDAYITIVYPDISRSRAKALIEGGSVILDGKIVVKPSLAVNDSIVHELKVNKDAIPYVSRGGLKLEGALRAFGITAEGKVCADIGASTGGFTDCLLKRGAKRVYAVDSGTDQLSPALRTDSKVISLEQFNARELVSDSFGELCDLAVADLSFISQTYVLSPIASILTQGGEYVGLIKPQFECGRSALSKSGIVKDKKHHAHAIKHVIDAAESAGFEVKNVIRSPIKGGDGNTEFLFYAVRCDAPRRGLVSDRDITILVQKEANDG